MMRPSTTLHLSLAVVLLLALCCLLLLFSTMETAVPGAHHAESPSVVHKRNIIHKNAETVANQFLDAQPQDSELDLEMEEVDDNLAQVAAEDDSAVLEADWKQVDNVPPGTFPNKTKEMQFGIRHGHRLAHIAARASQTSAPSSSDDSNPVLDLDSKEFIPFPQHLVRKEFAHLPRAIIEAEYFRFEDEFGLISTEWSDEQVLAALQQLVDIYAQGNIQIRIRKREALARVKLSRVRALAYWFYVDYPRATRDLTPERLARKTLLDEMLGPELLSVFQALDRERQGLFDFITGWPEERTVWEVENVVGMYPSFYYQFMNGGGNLGCMRFRTGDCNTKRIVKLAGRKGEEEKVYAKCFRFSKRQGDDFVVRAWENYEFKPEMAIRLVAHEFGHSVRLRHPKLANGADCVQVNDWTKTNLMHQVYRMAPRAHTCRVTGWPELAATATYLDDEQVEQARANIKYDLRQSPRVRGTRQMGKTTEMLGEKTCLAVPVRAFVAWRDSEVSGKLRRIRWKSATTFSPADELRVSVGTWEGRVWKERAFEIAKLHALGAHIHQEQDIHKLHLRVGESLILASTRDDVDLRPESHFYSNAQTLVSDVVAAMPLKRREHPTINQVVSERDQNSLYPQVAPRASLVVDHLVQTSMAAAAGWQTVSTCADWIFNFDIE